MSPAPPGQVPWCPSRLHSGNTQRIPAGHSSHFQQAPPPAHARKLCTHSRPYQRAAQQDVRLYLSAAAEAAPTMASSWLLCRPCASLPPQPAPTMLPGNQPLWQAKHASGKAICSQQHPRASGPAASFLAANRAGTSSPSLTSLPPKRPPPCCPTAATRANSTPRNPNHCARDTPTHPAQRRRKFTYFMKKMLMKVKNTT